MGMALRMTKCFVYVVRYKETMDVRLEFRTIYIVDRETFVTYYENPVAQKTSVKNRIGLPCYSIHGNNSVCASCSVRKENRTSFVTRNDLGMIFIVQSEETVWNGHPAYLITVKKGSTQKFGG